jgi:hypothetical protein
MASRSSSDRKLSSQPDNAPLTDYAQDNALLENCGFRAAITCKSEQGSTIELMTKTRSAAMAWHFESCTFYLHRRPGMSEVTAPSPRV